MTAEGRHAIQSITALQSILAIQILALIAYVQETGPMRLEVLAVYGIVVLFPMVSLYALIQLRMNGSTHHAFDRTTVMFARIALIAGVAMATLVAVAAIRGDLPGQRVYIKPIYVTKFYWSYGDIDGVYVAHKVSGANFSSSDVPPLLDLVISIPKDVADHWKIAVVKTYDASGNPLEAIRPIRRTNESSATQERWRVRNLDRNDYIFKVFFVPINKDDKKAIPKDIEKAVDEMRYDFRAIEPIEA